MSVQRGGAENAEETRRKLLKPCVGKDCRNVGEPDPEFGEFLCADCCAEMEFWLQFYASRDAVVTGGRN